MTKTDRYSRAETDRYSSSKTDGYCNAETDKYKCAKTQRQTDAAMRKNVELDRTFREQDRCTLFKKWEMTREGGGT
jgi:hypothetical protein